MDVDETQDFGRRIPPLGAGNPMLIWSEEPGSDVVLVEDDTSSCGDDCSSGSESQSE